MEGNYSLSDLRAVTDGGGFGMNNGGLLILIVLFLLFGGGFNGRDGIGTYATAASQQEILFGQRFDALGQKINSIGDGICSSTYALNNSILGEGRAVQSQLSSYHTENQRNVDALRYDMANMNAATNANTTAQTQKILDALQQNKIETLQGQVNALQMQLNMCGVVRYPTASTYYAGSNPFCHCGSGCGCGV